MNVAIYARYSSDMQSDTSIEDQIRLCEELTNREKWTIYNCYSDRAVSGASMMRPGIQALMQDASAGKFSIVVSEALDRLSRDQEDIAGIYKRMQFAGVKIITLSEGEVSNLHIGLKGTMNAMFLKDLADKTRRGLSGRIQKGKSGGGILYGYDVIRLFDEEGEPIRGERKINPEQAEIVRRIFQEYIGGKSPKAIAVGLNKDRIPCPRGSAWGASTIYGNRHRGSGILNNELYVGQLIWNRQRFIKDPDTGRRVPRINSEELWVRKDVPELRIIDQDLWNKTKEKQGKIAESHSEFWGKQRPKNLLSHLLKCGCCCGGFSKFSNDRYGCSTLRNKGTCTNKNKIHQQDLEKIICDALQSHLMKPEACALFCDVYAQTLNELRKEKTYKIAGYKAELDKIKKRREAIMKAIYDGYNTPDMKDEFNGIVERRKELEKLLSNMEEKPVRLHPNMSTHYHNKVQGLLSSLNSEKHRAESADKLRSLIDKIVLTPKEGTNELSIKLYGDLGGILSIAMHDSKPLKDNNFLEQLKMVARARSALTFLFNAFDL